MKGKTKIRVTRVRVDSWWYERIQGEFVLVFHTHSNDEKTIKWTAIDRKFIDQFEEIAHKYDTLPFDIMIIEKTTQTRNGSPVLKFECRECE